VIAVMTHPVEQHKIYKSVNDINEIDICKLTGVAIGAWERPVDESWLNTFCLFANPALSPLPSREIHASTGGCHLLNLLRLHQTWKLQSEF